MLVGGGTILHCRTLGTISAMPGLPGSLGSTEWALGSLGISVLCGGGQSYASGKMLPKCMTLHV